MSFFGFTFDHRSKGIKVSPAILAGGLFGAALVALGIAGIFSVAELWAATIGALFVAICLGLLTLVMAGIDQSS